MSVHQLSLAGGSELSELLSYAVAPKALGFDPTQQFFRIRATTPANFRGAELFVQESCKLGAGQVVEKRVAEHCLNESLTLLRFQRIRLPYAETC
ncbi:MAG: hypothetical protein BWY83_02737 [bacterium ADurb.Bin478]|nr:MAG: hypothetical protein BWY83_02737 [bacterium ADurb.Bin478]